jgi:hypothetical protein
MHECAQHNESQCHNSRHTASHVTCAFKTNSIFLSLHSACCHKHTRLTVLLSQCVLMHLLVNCSHLQQCISKLSKSEAMSHHVHCSSVPSHLFVECASHLVKNLHLRVFMCATGILLGRLKAWASLRSGMCALIDCVLLNEKLEQSMDCFNAGNQCLTILPRRASASNESTLKLLQQLAHHHGTSTGTTPLEHSSRCLPSAAFARNFTSHWFMCSTNIPHSFVSSRS